MSLGKSPMKNSKNLSTLPLERTNWKLEVSKPPKEQRSKSIHWRSKERTLREEVEKTKMKLVSCSSSARLKLCLGVNLERAEKGLQRRKEAKTIKNRQETGKRQRDKSKSEKSARDHSRISPTQSKKETMKSKTQDKVKRVKIDKSSKIQGFIWKFEDSRTKFAKEEKLLIKKKEREKEPQGLILPFLNFILH
ncbi:hypothetical protein Tco_0412130 [Tanacetum coccineum]